MQSRDWTVVRKSRRMMWPGVITAKVRVIKEKQQHTEVVEIWVLFANRKRN